MELFQSQIQVQSSVFKQRYQKMKKQVDLLKSHLDGVRQWGSESSHPHLQKNSKNSVRWRIQKLLDPNSHFLEFSSLAGFQMYDFNTPAGGVITGIGQVSGRECVIVANDPTVKGGSYLPITVKKHLRAQEVALQNHLPCFYLVDSGGAFLPLQSEVFADKDHFGAFFYNQSQMQALGLDQISIVLGQCTAGGAYIPALSDETIMVKGQSAIFLGGPPLVFSVTGEKISAEELGGAELHCKQSGVADYLANTEDEAIEKARALLTNHAERKRYSLPTYQVEEPYYKAEEIYGIIPEDTREPYDIKELLARIVDGSQWQEFKEHFGTTIFTAQTRICGFPVGILASQGVLFSNSALKATHFIELCDRKGIPLIFFQNVPGFMVGQEYESEGIAKHGAKMVTAVSLSRVPRFTVIVGASYGAGNYGMCGRAYRPRQLWTWPSAKIGVMGAEVAHDILSSIGKKNLSNEAKKTILEKYQKESTPYYCTARLFDDGLIDPLETRKVLAMGIRASLNAPLSERKKGIYRM